MAKFIRILRLSFIHLKRNDPLRLAAATAFFTTFALPAILIILIQSLGLIFPRRMVSRDLLQHLADVIGPGTVNDLHTTLRNVRHLATTWYFATGGFLFLIFVSTTLFAVIRASLNQVWNITLTQKPNLVVTLLQRAKAFLIIVVTGILFLVVSSVEGLKVLLGEYVTEIWGNNTVWPQYLFNQFVSLVVVSVWFCILFRFLPDGHPVWPVALAGGLFTGVLFSIGKLLLGFLLSYSNMQTIYGASTSMALLLLFVFYSSLMFYYGACFTKVWAEHKQRPITGKKIK